MKLNFIFGLLFSVVALQMKGAGGTPEGASSVCSFSWVGAGSLHYA